MLPSMLGMTPKKQLQGQAGSNLLTSASRARERCGHTGCWVRGKTLKSFEPSGCGRAPSSMGLPALSSAPGCTGTPPSLRPPASAAPLLQQGLGKVGQRPQHRLPPSISTSKAYLPHSLCWSGVTSPDPAQGTLYPTHPLRSATPALSPVAQLALSFSGAWLPRRALCRLFSVPGPQQKLCSCQSLPGVGGEMGIPAKTDSLARSGFNAAAPPLPSLPFPCI